MERDYNPKKAGEYWSWRAQKHEFHKAVLDIGKPKYINEAYSQWELTTVFNELPDLEGMNVLDIGCGVGRVLIPLLEHGALVSGIDVSPEMLNICGKKTRQAGYNVLLKQASVDGMPFDDGIFDIVVCVGVFEHLPDNTRYQALREIIRVLKGCGGILILLMNNEHSIYLSEAAKNSNLQEQRNDGYYCSVISAGSICEFLKKNMDDISVIGTNPHYSRLVNSLGGVRVPAFILFYYLKLMQPILSNLINRAVRKDLAQGEKRLDDPHATHILIKTTKR